VIVKKWEGPPLAGRVPHFLIYSQTKLALWFPDTYTLVNQMDLIGNTMKEFITINELKLLVDSGSVTGASIINVEDFDRLEYVIAVSFNKNIGSSLICSKREPDEAKAYKKLDSAASDLIAVGIRKNISLDLA